MTYKELLERAFQLGNEAKAIVGNPTATPEEKAKVPQMLAEMRQLKADADTLATIDREGGVLADLMKDAPGKLGRENGGSAPENFKTWGSFLQAAHLAINKNKPDARLEWFEDEVSSREAKDMSGESGASGGYLIPVEFRAQLLGVMQDSAIVRPRATVIPMSRRQVSIPALDQTQSLATGVPRWFGGLTFHWIGEGEQKPSSDPKFREVNLVAKKLVGFTRASDELLADSAISLEAFLAGPLGLAGGIAWMEDYAFFWGTGVAQPLGIFNSPATLSVRRNISGKVQFSDFVRMIAAHRLTPRSRWAISQTVLPDVYTMEDSEGNLIWANGVNGAPPTILGIPYDVSEMLQPKGTTGDVLLADYSFYLIGDRQSTTVESTKFEAWQYDKTSWRAVHRVDGQPWLNAPFTYQDGTTQVSPFVVLSSDVS